MLDRLGLFHFPHLTLKSQIILVPKESLDMQVPPIAQNFSLDLDTDYCENGIASDYYPTANWKAIIS